MMQHAWSDLQLHGRMRLRMLLALLVWWHVQLQCAQKMRSSLPQLQRCLAAWPAVAWAWMRGSPAEDTMCSEADRCTVKIKCTE